MVAITFTCAGCHKSPLRHVNLYSNQSTSRTRKCFASFSRLGLPLKFNAGRVSPLKNTTLISTNAFARWHAEQIICIESVASLAIGTNGTDPQSGKTCDYIYILSIYIDQLRANT